MELTDLLIHELIILEIRYFWHYVNYQMFILEEQMNKNHINLLLFFLVIEKDLIRLYLQLYIKPLLKMPFPLLLIFLIK